MRISSSVTLLGVLSILFTGCLARQVATDGRTFRQALLDMYTDQVMDNLIRASEGQPFVQLSYRNLIVTDTQTAKASLADESDPTNAKTVAQRTGKLFTGMHAYTNKLFFGGSLERDRQMQFQADPVAGKADVYEYYMAFALDPTLFCSSESEPRCPVHIKKRCGSKWYWVPEDAGGVFLQLVLKTSFMLGPEPPPPIYWETTAAKVDQQFGKMGEANPGHHVITFTSPVPNDDGFALISLADGRKIRLQLSALLTEPYEPNLKNQKQKPGPKRGTPVTKLFADDDPIVTILYAPDDKMKEGVLASLLANRPAQVFAASNPNLGSKPKSPEAQRLDDLLANYRRAHRDNP